MADQCEGVADGYTFDVGALSENIGVDLFHADAEQERAQLAALP